MDVHVKSPKRREQDLGIVVTCALLSFCTFPVSPVGAVVFMLTAGFKAIDLLVDSVTRRQSVETAILYHTQRGIVLPNVRQQQPLPVRRLAGLAMIFAAIAIITANAGTRNLAPAELIQPGTSIDSQWVVTIYRGPNALAITVAAALAIFGSLNLVTSNRKGILASGIILAIACAAGFFNPIVSAYPVRESPFKAVAEPTIKLQERASPLIYSAFLGATSLCLLLIGAFTKPDP